MVSAYAISLHKKMHVQSHQSDWLAGPSHHVANDILHVIGARYVENDLGTFVPWPRKRVH